MLYINILRPLIARRLGQLYLLFIGATDMVDSQRKLLGNRLGKQVAEKRKMLGMTQGQLSEQIGVDAETISRFERGVTVPSLVTLYNLAGALRCRSADLLSESSVDPSDQVAKLSAQLVGLAYRDREFVIDQIKRLCDQLRKRG